MKQLFPRNHNSPKFLSYKGNFPETNVEFLFPTINKPAGPNSRHVRSEILTKANFPSHPLILCVHLIQVDTGCLNSYAVQMQGSKMWLLWPPPKRDADGILVNSTDGLRPMATILYPGDLLVFYPGWLHETHVIEHPSLSMSIYWDHRHPDFRPTEFYARHASDILKAYPEEYCSCAEEWHAEDSGDGIDVCQAIRLQRLFSYALVSFMMMSMICFVVIAAVVVSSLLKRCTAESHHVRSD
jgi:hypothetical protein